MVWFQIAKREYIPAQKGPGQFVWFKNDWADYRIGGGVEEGVIPPYGQQELDVYRALTKGGYFLSKIQTQSAVAKVVPKQKVGNGG